MDESDNYDDILPEDLDEDISALEDNPSEEGIEQRTDIIVSSGAEPLSPDTPVYRLRLIYSHETFLAVYSGDPLEPGSMVLVPTRYGRDLAQIIGPIRRRDPQIFSELTRIERPATREDLEKADHNRLQEQEAFRICRQKIELHALGMKLVSVHYLLEEAKILFFFTAENRVDFRELVKDLVGVFKSRIELRQIGVRDESRVIGGLGICGRGYCCHMVSDKLKPVSIKMAKDQNLSLNSIKISGLCGRLLCCLAYEHCFYGEQRRLIPPEGYKLSYEGAQWKVLEANVILGLVKIGSEDGRQIHISASAFEKIDGRWSIVKKD
ncbi:MAG: hypothetical protein LBB98_04550 [Treponema sp.]|jgi:cell fate regulator YaaT (PSP1 superfamily)|nr:hypothetical protein [Treponema sp.]